MSEFRDGEGKKDLDWNPSNGLDISESYLKESEWENEAQKYEREIF